MVEVGFTVDAVPFGGGFEVTVRLGVVELLWRRYPGDVAADEAAAVSAAVDDLGGLFAHAVAGSRVHR